MRLITVLLALALVLAGCAARYFPELAHNGDPELNAFVEDWYAGQLRALKEESLCCSDRGRVHIIRFTWLRSFHRPVVLRAEKAFGGRWVLRTKIGSGVAGYSSRHLITDRVRYLSDSEAAQVLALVDISSGFWEISAREPSTIDGAIIVRADGSHWIVEVRDGKRYHFVDRWTPRDGRNHEIGALLMALAREKFGDIY